MPLEQLLYAIVILLLVGVGLHFLRGTRIDGTIKLIIYVLVFAAIAYWLITEILPASGLGG